MIKKIDNIRKIGRMKVKTFFKLIEEYVNKY